MSESPAARWSFPTNITIGAGTISSLRELCVAHGILRPLLVTDPGLVNLPSFTRVQAALAADTPVFSDLRSNPVGENVEDGAEALRAGNHDGVIAVGGGSALDVGKAIAFHAGQSLPLWDFEDVGDNWTLADAAAIVPVIAVPTTAGTGSEVGRASVITDTAAGRKVIIFHPKMLPVAVLCDPELTIGLPRQLTVGTGMDALSHSLEAICAPSYHPMAQGIGFEGCRLVLEHLPRVVTDPEDLESRTHMMAAAAMGAVAFQKGLGGMHALAHPIGAAFDTHHGMTNAVLMPHVLRANRTAIEPTIERLGSFVGLSGGFDGFVEMILERSSTFDVPESLMSMGVDVDAADQIAAAAVLDPSAGGNPVPLTEELAATVFLRACEGR